MTIEVRVPQLPESVADATLVSWHKKPGDAVARDENLVDLETDKVVLEVPAPAAGVLKEIKLSDGTTVTSGQLLALIEEGARPCRAPARPPSCGLGGGPATPAADAAKAAAAASAASRMRRGKAESRRQARGRGEKVDPKAVAGSGRDGRVSKSDVVNYLSAKDARAGARAGRRTAPPSAGGARPDARAARAPISACP